MVLTPEEYSKIVKMNGRYVCARTIKRMAKKGMLPSHTIVHNKKCGMILEIEQVPEHIRNNFTVMLRPKIKTQPL